MAVGDYIICKYVASSGAVGVFSELGTSVVAEIPVLGAVAPNGTFYFVKTAKGLLISDRVIQNSISWDVLNSGKYIQGTPFLMSNDAMTSSNTPAPFVASASSYNTVYEPWKAFDKTTSTMWYVNATSGWIKLDFGKTYKVVQYSITSASTNQTPKTWTFEGSNDNTNWTTLDTRTNITAWTENAKQTFVVSSSTEYRYFRLNISANNGNANIRIDSLDIEYSINDCKIRSLTGGVAYADANGNSSISNSNLGAWPTNNEWDKYIVNFPASKIQSGKTLDDVFHWNGVHTLVSETPILSWAAASNRVMRGNYTANSVFSPTSAQTTTAIGFRPVLEYKEV
ncbi:discoidin domain-containing protein [Paenibacillus tianjinensis]|uniref:Discoidin domain-containing protein n=1 Tax=Paenibacillus tianjinensis TaxID=2810347 RepID=A0ABX7L859_9BACL|nr:discoidin domain-containing protein [Paenibacillus tianjinensis]QSF43563.1 discoidin domain-containing protein [Paenibacillus tianjinensis]